MLKPIFNLDLAPPSPRGVPGEGPGCQFPKEIDGFGPIPARILGVGTESVIFMLALSVARIVRSSCVLVWGHRSPLSDRSCCWFWSDGFVGADGLPGASFVKILSWTGPGIGQTNRLAEN